MSRARTVALATSVYFASYILIGALGGAVGPTLGPFAAQVGVGLSTIGIILTTRSLGYLAGALGSTRWMDKTRLHHGLAAFALVAGAILAALPWARSLGLLVVLVVPLGFATAGLDVGVSTMLLHAHRDRSAPYVSALHFCYGVGGLVAPFLVAAFVVGKETSIYPVLTVGFALLAVLYLTLPDSVCLDASAIVHKVGGAEATESTCPASAPKVSPRGLRDRFTAATSVILIYVGAEIGFASWLYIFVNLQFGAPIATAITGGFWAAFSLSRLGAVFAAQRFAPERILTAAFASGVAFAVLLVLSHQALALVWIGALGMGASVGPIYPNVINAYSRRYELTGRRFGTIAIASCSGSMVFPWLIGRLLDVGGPAVVPIVTGSLLLLAASVAWTFFRRKTIVTGAP